MTYITSSTPVSAVKTANYTVLPTDDNLYGDTSSAALTFTLFDATLLPGKILRFKNIGSSASYLLRLQPFTGQTIDGAPSRTLMINDGINLQSVAGNWQVITGYYPATDRSVYGQTTVKSGDTILANAVASGTYQSFASQYSLPANSLVAGLELIYEGNGLFTTTVGGPTTTASVMVGTTEVLNTGPLNLLLGMTNGAYYFKIMFKVESVGTSGVLRTYGKLDFQSGSNPNTTTGIIIPSSNKTIDTTIMNTLTLRAAMSASTTGNSNTLRDINIYEIRPPKSAN